MRFVIRDLFSSFLYLIFICCVQSDHNFGYFWNPNFNRTMCFFPLSCANGSFCLLPCLDSLPTYFPPVGYISCWRRCIARFPCVYFCQFSFNGKIKLCLCTLSLRTHLYMLLVRFWHKEICLFIRLWLECVYC